MLPYSREILFSVFQSYQSSYGWLIVLFYLGLLPGLWWLIRAAPGPVARFWALWVLALAWALVGQLFFVKTFLAYDFIARYEAWLFFAQTLGLLWAGGWGLRSGAAFRAPGSAWLSGIMCFIGLLMLPLWDFVAQLNAGQEWPAALSAARWFGTAPGPTVVVTFALLLRIRAHWLLWVLPLVWSFKAGLVAYWLGLTSDYSLLLVGVVAAIFAVINTRHPGWNGLGRDSGRAK